MACYSEIEMTKKLFSQYKNIYKNNLKRLCQTKIFFFFGSLLCRKDSIMGSLVTERWRARPQTTRALMSNPVSRGKNEMNRVLGHLCAHIGRAGPGEPPEDGEMIEMTLSYRHRIRNSSPGSLRPRTLSLGHGGSPQC